MFSLHTNHTHTHSSLTHQRWGLEFSIWTWVALRVHTQRLKTWFGLFWCINTEENLKHLTRLIWFLPFFHDNHGNHITHWVRTSRPHVLVSRMMTMATGGTPAAPAVPFVITFGYKNFKQDGTNKRSADSKVSTQIKDAGSTTWNFIRHLKTHQDRSVTLEHMDDQLSISYVMFT